MLNNFEKALALVLKSEGGFVNNPADPGGMTNLGVTKKAWESYVGHGVSQAVMESLMPAGVAPFYRTRYWNNAQCDYMPTGVDYMLFDFAVNAGVSRAIKTLQSAVGAVPDGSIGAATMSAIEVCPDLPDRFADEKRNFYQSLPTFPTFGRGWLNRVNEVLANAKTF